MQGLVDVPVQDSNFEADNVSSQQNQQKKPILKVKSQSSLSAVLDPLSRIGEVEVYPSETFKNQSQISSNEELEEEGVDPTRSDIDQSVSMNMNMRDHSTYHN